MESPKTSGKAVVPMNTPAAIAARKKRNKRILIVVGAVTILGGLGVGAYFLLAKKPNGPMPDTGGSEPDGSMPTLPAYTAGGGSGSPSPSPSTNSKFPLKRGSKGTEVRNIQAWLNQRFNAKLVVDGNWGTKTDAALKAAGYPIEISEEIYNAAKRQMESGTVNATQPQPQTPGTTGAVNDPDAFAALFANAVNLRDTATIGKMLAVMKSTSDYVNVNSRFSQIYTKNRSGAQARRTLVMATVGSDMPWTATQLASHSAHLKRIGLKLQSDGKWTLGSAFLEPEVWLASTLSATQVQAMSGEVLPIKPGVVLGVLVGATKNKLFVFQAQDGMNYFIRQEDAMEVQVNGAPIN